MGNQNLGFEEMEKWFTLRTKKHIDCVNKYLYKISELNFPEIDKTLLVLDSHDASKFENPEYIPYVHLSWKYKKRTIGEEYFPPEEIEKLIHLATYHHVKNNKHHPEFWDYKTTPDSINPRDRDKAPDNMVDGTKMPLTHVAQMVADWMAMAEEKSISSQDIYHDALEWAKNNINFRWKFSSRQICFIYRLMELI